MSNCVELKQDNKGIATVILNDPNGKNTFTPEIIEGLDTVFKDINSRADVKVVVIHGFASYFCCGGTKTELVRIFNKEITFADLAFYRLLLDCKCPTIAAMQGHAIGGGLAFAAYADFLVFSSDSFYAANFMKYGFTPGMGSTYMLPKKLGNYIGNRLMFSAENHQGKQLLEMGLRWPVVKAKEVIDTAYDIANRFVDKPVLSLQLLKKQINKTIYKELPDCINDELHMHELSFAQPEVKDRIERLFGQ